MIKILKQEQKMIDYNLPIEIISNIFQNKEEIKDFTALMKKIEPENNFFYDRLKLQELFFNLNPNIFYDKKFREIFLKANYEKKYFKRFVADMGITEELSKENKWKIIKKIYSFSWGSNSQTRSFVKHFELDKSLIPDETDLKEELEEFPPSQNPYEEMFQYQTDIFHNAFDLLRKPNQGFIIQIPTGGGKTKIGMELVTKLFNTKNNQKILWLADRKELCEQATLAFEKIWRHKGTKKILLNRCWGKFNFNQNLNGNILTVATVDKIINLQKKDTSINANIIIFDEAHHAAAPQYKNAVIYSRTNGANLIGLTATPGRSYENESENKKLSEMFDDTLLRIKDTVTNTGKNLSSIQYLQTIGILSKPIKKPEIVIPKLKNIFSSKELKSIEKKTDYSLTDLEKIGRNSLRNYKILEELIKVVKTEKKILFFATSVTQSKLMFAVIKHLGFSAAHIDASTNSEFREDSIKKFKNSKIQVLFNNQVLTAGFDEPTIDVIFIAKPTKSPISLLQMIGRGMRGKSVGGTDYFDLYYVRDGILENFVDVDEIFNMFSAYFGKEK
jgi:DNA repair protein RadD